MIVLGIETSCDETSAAIIKDGVVLSNKVYSQEVHKIYGGVVPELASIDHERNIYHITKEALSFAKINLNQINLIAVTYGSGLLSSLIVGLNFAKGLSIGLNIPLIGINHLEGHLSSSLINNNVAPLFVESHRLSPFNIRGTDVDVILDLMIHDLDVILSLIFGTPSSVSAVGIPVLTKTADIANARIEFDTGAIANVTASRVSTSTQRKFRVFHEGQYLSMDFGGGEVRLVTHDSTQGSGQLALQEQRWSLQKGDALLAETEAFISAIEAHSPCQVTGYDGVAALELAESIITDMQARAL